MENCSTDTLLSLKHLPGLRHASPYSSFSASQPSFNLAPHPLQWHPPGGLHESRFIALYSEADCPHINLVRDQHPQQGGTSNLLCRDPAKVYPSPPSGPSSKTTVPLPEENGEYRPVYSTQLLGVLDSPTVMRREDLSSHIPLTPPPTLPHPTLALPDANVDVDVDVDVDVEFEDEEDKGLDHEYDDEDDVPFCSASETSSHSADTDLPLSPLSPTWDPHRRSERALVPETPSGSEQVHSLWSPVVATKALPDPSLAYSDDVSPYASRPTPFSLLEVDAPRPVLAPISIPWSPHPSYDIEHDSPPSTMSDAWSSPSTDYDELPPPSSPLISRLNLPDDDDEMPHIIPSSPCRRSCSDLPDTDVEMSHLSESDDASSVVSSSPSQILLSLPGADTDDELLPVDSMSLTPAAAASFLPCPPGQPLLFIDDPRDVPLLRSPSPEDFHISLSPEDITDPELSQLFELRKRSIAAANAAPADGSDLFTRVEARKTRRRERERCKELSDLLRLKLEGNKVGTTSPKSHEDEQLQPQPQQQRDRQNHRRRGALSSMSQLVAQMVFRRNDTSRPLAKRKTGMIPREYIRSSLSRAASG